MSLFKKIFIDHCRETDMPQTYWQHFAFGFGNSVKLFVAALAGIVHAIIPAAFPFYTARRVVKSFKAIVDSGRHTQDFKDIIPTGYLLKKHLKK